MTDTPDTTTDAAVQEWLTGSTVPTPAVDEAAATPETSTAGKHQHRRTRERRRHRCGRTSSAAGTGTGKPTKPTAQRPSGKNARPTGKRGR